MKLDMTKDDYRRLTGPLYGEGRSKLQRMMPPPAHAPIVRGKAPSKPRKHDYVEEPGKSFEYGEINSVSGGYAYVKFSSSKGKSYTPIEIAHLAYLGKKGNKHVWVERMPT